MKLMTMILGLAAAAAVYGAEPAVREPNADQAEVKAEEPATVPAAKVVPAEPADEAPAVRVGKHTLTWGDLRRRTEAILAMRGGTHEAVMRPMVMSMVVEQFAFTAVALDAVERYGVTLSDEERAEALKTVEAETGMTLEGMLAQAPMSEEEAMADLELSLKLQKLIAEQVDSKITVADADVEEAIAKTKEEAAAARAEMEGYAKAIAEGTATIEDLAKEHSPISEAIEFPLDQVPPGVAKALETLEIGKVSPLFEEEGVAALFKVLERDTAAADPKAAIEAIAERLAKGEDFAAVAKAESDCPSSAEGGNLGEFGRGMMVPEFEKAAFEQPVGEVGEPVRTQFGWHIIKVTARDDAAGKVTASHILKMAKPATVKAVALLKPCPTELPDAETVREALKAERIAEGQQAFMLELEKAAGEPWIDPALERIAWGPKMEMPPLPEAEPAAE